MGADGAQIDRLGDRDGVTVETDQGQSLAELAPGLDEEILEPHPQPKRFVLAVECGGGDVDRHRPDPSCPGDGCHPYLLVDRHFLLIEAFRVAEVRGDNISRVADQRDHPRARHQLP